MTRFVRCARLALLGAAALAACLGALWASITAGVWLAVHIVAGDVGPWPTRAITGAGLVATAWILTRAVQLLAADLRDIRRLERGR